jgi:hypothetical protein
VEDAERVVVAGVLGAGPDPRDEAELLDAVEPEEDGGRDEGQLRLREGDPVIEGIADRRRDREPRAGYGPDTIAPSRQHDHVRHPPPPLSGLLGYADEPDWLAPGAELLHDVVPVRCWTPVHGRRS